LERYRALIEEAIRRGDWAETLLAEQVILEGLGEAILTRIEQGLMKRGAAFGRMRRTLLLQEEAHHAFGRRMLERAFAAGASSPERLRERAEEYLALAQEMIVTLTELFHAIDEDASAWAADLRRHLPAWLTPSPRPSPFEGGGEGGGGVAGPAVA
jgi:hypothetical protein